MTAADPSLERGARRVARILRDAGFEAYYAGGCVRDLVLGLDPKDYDIATDATPEEIGKLFRRTLFLGAAFGVVQVRLHGHGYEVATYRTEGEYADGRRPDAVAYTRSKEEDVARRDFTINALLMEPETREVIDLVGGLPDLRGGLVRAVGDPVARFNEDRLRMLRAVRFATRFGFELEPATRDAIGVYASNLGPVSAERILQELEGIFATPRVADGLRLLDALGLASGALPFLPEDASERAARLDPVARATLPVGPSEERFALVFALLFGPSDGAAAEEYLRAMKVSRSLIRRVQSILRARPVLEEAEAVEGPSGTELLRLAAAPERNLYAGYAEGLGLGRALERLAVAARDFDERPLPERPLVTGDDLKGLGQKPGPAFKSLLREVDDRVLDRTLTTKPQALSWLKARLS